MVEAMQLNISKLSNISYYTSAQVLAIIFMHKRLDLTTVSSQCLWNISTIAGVNLIIFD